MTYFDDIRGGFETAAPMGYWPFYAAEGSGSAVWDYSGNGLPDAALSGTYSRGATLTLDGAEDNSLVLTGAGAGAAEIYSPFVPSAFSVECIFESTDGGTLIDRDYSGERIFTVALDTGSIKLTKTSGTTGSRTTTVDTYDDGERHHLVVSFNADETKIIVDGVTVDTHTWAEDFDGTGTFLGIGGSFNGGTSPTTLQFTGTIDEVAWYETALTEADAAIHAGWLGLGGVTDVTGTISAVSPASTSFFFSATPEPSISSPFIVASEPVGWWEADGVTGLDTGDEITSLPDSSGNSHTATPLGSTGPTWTDVSTPTGRPSMYFEANDTLGAEDTGLQAPSLSASTPTQTLAAVVWAYPGYDAEMAIVASTDPGGLYWQMQTSRHTLATAQEGTVLGYEGTTPIPNPDDTTFPSISDKANWVVVMVEVEDGVGARHYTNGELDGDTVLGGSLSGAGTMLIGTYGDGTINPWHGYISAVVRWDRLLTDEEKREISADLRDKWIEVVPRVRAFSARSFMLFEGLVEDLGPGEVPLFATLVATSTLSVALTAWHPGTVLNPFDVTSPASVDFGDAEDTVDPEAQAGDEGAFDLWYRIESDAASTMTLTWSGSFSVGFEVWVAPPEDLPSSVDEITLMEFGNGPTLDVATGADQVYYVRVHPLDDADNAGTGTLSWSFVARPDGFIELLADETAYDSPGYVTVSVTSATEEGDVVFAIDGTDVFTDTADEAGMIVSVSIPIPPGTTAGSHTITATDVESGEISAADFDLILFGLNDPSPLPPLEPTTPFSHDDVIHWVFEDFLPVIDDQETYTFPHNPTQMSSPHASRVLNPDHSSAPDGQVILTEGAGLPNEWTWEGTCFSQEHHDALEAWHANERRFWIIDHLQRAWVVTFETLEWTYVKDPQHPWAQRYRAKCFIYAGPVMLEETP